MVILEMRKIAALAVRIFVMLGSTASVAVETLAAAIANTGQQHPCCSYRDNGDDDTGKVRKNDCGVSSSNSKSKNQRKRRGITT